MSSSSLPRFIDNKIRVRRLSRELIAVQSRRKFMWIVTAVSLTSLLLVSIISSFSYYTSGSGIASIKHDREFQTTPVSSSTPASSISEAFQSVLNTMHSLSHSIASVRERLTLSPPSSLHEISPDSIAIAMSPTNAHVASTSTANVFIQSLVETAEVGSQMQFPIFRMTAVAHDAEANVFTHEMKLPNPSNLLERGHIRSSAKNKAFFESQFNNHGIRVLTFASERKLRHSFISSSPHGPPKSMTLLFELEANMDDRYDTSNKASSKFEIDAQTRSVLTGAVRLKMGSEIFFCIKSPSRAASTFGSWDSDDFVHSNVFKLELNSSKLANSKAGFYVTINDLSFDLISSISTISRQDCLLSLTQSAT